MSENHQENPAQEPFERNDAPKANGHNTSQSSEDASARHEPSDAEWEALFGSRPKPSAEAPADLEMLISVVRKAHGDLSKRLSLVNGQIVSDSSHCGISEGLVCVKRIKSAENFARLISRMPDNESLLNGIPRGAEVDKPIKLTLKDLLTGLEDDGLTIARTKGAFMFVEGIGPMQFDCDGTGLGRPDNAALKAKVAAAGGLAGAIFEVMPSLAKAMRVERASTSAGLFTVDADGKRTDFPDKGGKHLFPIVKDTTDTPRATKALYEHMVVAGYGWGDIGEAGQIIIRSPVDKTTGAAGRLLLEARPEVELPLQQEQRDAVAIDGEVIDTRVAIPDLSEKERKKFQKLEGEMREALKEEARAVRAAHTRKIAEKIAATTGQPVEDIMKKLVASYEGRLGPDWPLKFDDAALEGAIVGDVLDDPDKYLDKTLSDPLEPEYGGGRNKAVVEWWKVNPDILIIYSQAHGGQIYFLDRGPAAAFDDGVEAPAGMGAPKPTKPMPKHVAQLIISRYGDRLRFNGDTGKWHEFDGNCWKPQPHKVAFERASQWAWDEGLISAATKTEEKAVASAAFYMGVEAICRNDRRMLVKMKDFDVDPFLLGTPGGVVDLRTGEFRPARAEDMVSKQTLVDPADKADCPQWMAFLDQVTMGDAAVAAFLQRWFGYCLTGDASEQVFLFIFGPGENGKGVCVGVVVTILGDYAVTPENEVFTARKYQGHPQEIASLAGARIASISEVGDNSEWNETLLKKVTGGDILSAHFMRQDQFSFTPEFKLTITGNHLPTFPGGIIPAIRRRFRLLPFDYMPERKDTFLKQKLLTEASGILRWMIDGCVEWQAKGLRFPKALKGATDEYFNEEDLLGRWLKEMTEKKAGAWASAVEVFEHWREWRNGQGNYKLLDNPTTFGREMRHSPYKKGDKTDKEGKKRGYVDIVLKSLDNT